MKSKYFEKNVIFREKKTFTRISYFEKKIYVWADTDRNQSVSFMCQLTNDHKLQILPIGTLLQVQFK